MFRISDTVRHKCTRFCLDASTHRYCILQICLFLIMAPQGGVGKALGSGRSLFLPLKTRRAIKTLMSYSAKSALEHEPQQHLLISQDSPDGPYLSHKKHAPPSGGVYQTVSGKRSSTGVSFEIKKPFPDRNMFAPCAPFSAMKPADLTCLQ